jgi:predicted alpha/beta superfamily hydrolase
MRWRKLKCGEAIGLANRQGRIAAQCLLSAQQRHGSSSIAFALVAMTVCLHSLAATPESRDLLAHGQGNYSLPGTETFDVVSRQGKQYRIFVSVPAGTAPIKGYPVLVLLDANAYFAATYSALQVLSPPDPQLASMSLSGVHAMIVVGVGYPGDAPFNMARREFDFLPAHVATKPQAGIPWLNGGGADVFLSFLLDELRPAIAQHYPVDPDRQSLTGHSLGGYFALYVLANRPGAFRNYAAISPSLWWDEQHLVNDMSNQSPGAAGHDLHHVLIAVGSNETPGYPERSALIRTLGQSMQKQLQVRGGDHLDAGYEELAGEDHQAMFIASLPAILRLASK